MPDVMTLRNAILIAAGCFLSVTVFVCLMRATLGPRYTDRITASSIIGTKIILLIAVLALIVGESYLVDICLIYAIINFLSVVVLARSVLEKKEGSEEE